MNAMHIKWTKPFMMQNCVYYEEDFELLTMILSAMKWRENNGRIKLVADETAIGYYKKLGLDMIWDELEVLHVDDDINPKMFWAGGKIYALAQQKTPIAIMDTDFIVWKKLDFETMGDCTAIHYEELNDCIYPNVEYFKLKKAINLKFDENVLPCNTAFTVLKNEKFVKYYADKAKEFMLNSSDCEDYLRYMVFAEQRLFSMCAKKLGMNLTVFSDLKELFADNKVFTHIWGMKHRMQNDFELRRFFCKKCVERIKNDYPDIFDNIKEMEICKSEFM